MVIGGGLLGLEAAHGLAEARHAGDRHPSDADADGAPARRGGGLAAAAPRWKRAAQTILTGADTAEIVGEDGVSRRAAQGRRARSRPIIVVMAVGIRPDTALAKAAGLAGRARHRGRRHMVTSDPAHLWRSANASSIAAACYGLVAPLWDMAKVCADHLAEIGHAAVSRLASPRPSSRSPASTCSRPAISPAATAPRTSCCATPRAASTSASCVKDNRIVGAVLYGDTADGNWYFQLHARRHGRLGHPRRADLRPGLRRRARGGPERGRCGALRRCRDLRLQRRLQGQDRRGDHGEEAVHARRGARAHQGLGVLRLVHRPGRALLALTLGGDYSSAPATKPMCKCTDSPTTTCAATIVEQALKIDPAGDAGTGLEDAGRLRLVPPGAQLLPALRLARRIRRRQAVALRQRAVHANIQKDGTYSVVPRMWGGVTNPQRAARDRRRRRRNSTRRRSRSPAASARPVRRQEGGPARRLGRSQRRRDGLGPRLRQGAAHGEDLRRLRMVPLRHAGFDRARRQDRADDLGLVDAAQVQDRGLGLPAQLRRGDDQGFRRGLRRLAATSCTSAATAASRCAPPTCCARSRPRRRCSSTAPPSSSSTARRRAISSAPRRGSSASGSTTSRRGIVDDAERARSARTRGSSIRRSFMQDDPWAERAGGRGRANSHQHLAEVRPHGVAYDRRLARHRPGRQTFPRATRARCRCAAASEIAVFRTARRPVSTRWSTSARTSGGPLSPGHRPRQRRDLPAAQLEHRARDRRGAGRRTRAACRRSRCKVDAGRIYLLREAVLGAQRREAPDAMTPIRTTCPYCGVGCGISRDVDRRADGRRSRAIPSTPPIAAGCAPRARIWARRSGSKAGCSIPRSAGSAASWDKALDLVAERLRRDDRASTGRTASRSTSRASC